MSSPSSRRISLEALILSLTRSRLLLLTLAVPTSDMLVRMSASVKSLHEREHGLMLAHSPHLSPLVSALWTFSNARPSQSSLLATSSLPGPATFAARKRLRQGIHDAR